MAHGASEEYLDECWSSGWWASSEEESAAGTSPPSFCELGGDFGDGMSQSDSESDAQEPSEADENLKGDAASDMSLDDLLEAAKDIEDDNPE